MGAEGLSGPHQCLQPRQCRAAPILLRLQAVRPADRIAVHPQLRRPRRILIAPKSRAPTVPVPVPVPLPVPEPVPPVIECLPLSVEAPYDTSPIHHVPRATPRCLRMRGARPP